MYKYHRKYTEADFKIHKVLTLIELIYFIQFLQALVSHISSCIRSENVISADQTGGLREVQVHALH